MAKYRYLNTKFWDDGYISNLDPIEKLIFLYVLTNPATNISGVYELPLKNIALDTGIEKEMLQKIFDRFGKDKKIFYEDGWMCIKNFLKHQNHKSPKVQTGIKSELANVPEDKLNVFIGYGYGMDTQSHLYSNSYLNPYLDLTKQEGQDSPPVEVKGDVKRFIDFFYKATDKIRHIKPIIDGGKDGRMAKDRLKKYSNENLEQITIWYLTRKKKVKDSKGNWHEEYKNSPSISTMLSTSFLNELLSEQVNARDFTKENLDWVATLYPKNEDFESMKTELLDNMKMK